MKRAVSSASVLIATTALLEAALDCLLALIIESREVSQFMEFDPHERAGDSGRFHSLKSIKFAMEAGVPESSVSSPLGASTKGVEFFVVLRAHIWPIARG